MKETVRIVNEIDGDRVALARESSVAMLVEAELADGQILEL